MFHTKDTNGTEVKSPFVFFVNFVSFVRTGLFCNEFA